MRDYFDLKNEFSSMVEKARIELKGDCPLIEDAAILAASERIAELESMLVSRTKEVDDGIKRYNKSVSKQQKIIAELENQWISVEDRLPAYGDSVLLVGNGVVQKVTYSLDGADDVPDWFEPYYFDSDVGCSIPWNKPTHWMPLPKPPKEQGE